MTPGSQFWLNWVAQLLIAVGTIGAVIVALFGGRLRHWMFPPRLVISLADTRGTSTPVHITNPQDGSVRETQGRWYHVRVENRSRWSPATQTQLYLLRVEVLDAAGGNRISWVGDVPMRWAHQEIHPLARTIGHPANCDLCSVVRDKWVALHPLIEPHALTVRHRERCHLWATVQARSVEADSSFLRVEIAWDGLWSDDTEQMASHMIVRAVS